MAGRINVVFMAGAETRELKSPRFEDDRVQEDMRALRQAQEDGRLVDLDWISIRGGNIVAVHRENVATGPRVA